MAFLGGSAAAWLLLSLWMRDGEDVPLWLWLAAAPCALFVVALQVRLAGEALISPTRDPFRVSRGWILWFLTIAVVLSIGVGAFRAGGWWMAIGMAAVVGGLGALAATVCYLLKPVSPTPSETPSVSGATKGDDVRSGENGGWGPADR